jgi:hypothetical protein
LGLILSGGQPGTKEIWETYFIDNVQQGSEVSLGDFDLRLFMVNSYSDKPMFNPLKESTTVKLDFYALPAPGKSVLFPNGWMPSSDVDWELEFILPSPFEVAPRSGTATTLLGIEDSGRVAEDSFIWNGLTDDDMVVEIPVSLGVRSLVDVPGSGNTWAGNIGASCCNRKRCRCFKDIPHRGELTFGMSLPVMPTMNVDLSYQSSMHQNPRMSLGFGWASKASERLNETVEGSLIYEDPSGIVLRWEPDGPSNYTPVMADNYVKAEKPGTPAYRLTFRDNSRKEFNSGGRLIADVDRDGNTMTYTYSGADLASQSDGNGRAIYYDYGSRTDGQPVAIMPNSLMDPRKFELEYYSDSDPDAPDRLKKVISPEGETTEFIYFPLGRIQKIINRRPTLGDLEVEYTYDLDGRLSSEVANGELATYYSYFQHMTYAEVYDLTTEEESPPPLRTIQHEYDNHDNLVRRLENAGLEVAG